MRKYFTELGFWGRSIALVMLLMAFMLIAIIIGDVSAIMIFGKDAMAHSEPQVMRYLQGMLALGVFLLPAVTLCLLCRDGGRMARLSASPAPRPLSLALCAAIMIASLPLSGWLEEINLRMTLPESMQGIEDWMRQKEDQAARITEQLIKTPDMASMLANMIVLALIPALCEEMFFRVGIQQAIISDTTRLNPYWAAVVTAFIFSAIHLQFFGFVPRFVLGAELGLMLVITRSVWCPVLAHFVNNAIAVMGGYMEARGGEFSLSQAAESAWVIILSTVAAAALFTLLYKYEKKSKICFDISD